MGVVTGGLLAAQLVGAGLQVMSQVQQSRHEQRRLGQAAQQARAASIDRLRRGEDEERAVRERGEATRGRQRAGLSGLGFDITTAGTPLDIIESTAGLNFLDVLNVRRNALMDAQGLDFQARNLTAQRRGLRRALPFDVASTFITAGVNSANIGLGGRR